MVAVRFWQSLVMTTTRTMIGCASVVTAVLLGTACGSDDVAGRTAAAAVQGTVWTLDELAGESIADGVEVTLEYDGERIAGTGGCNQYNGEATFADGVVTIGAEIISTRMACQDPAAEVEFRYLEALPRAAGFVVEEDTLRIDDGEGEPLLIFTASD